MDCEIYFKLLAHAFDQGISLRTEYDPIDQRFMYLSSGQNSGDPLIRVSRLVGGYWATSASTKAELSTFISGAKDLEQEIILIAHEIGHHKSKFKNYEILMSRFLKKESSLTLSEKVLIYDEECFAWKTGRKILLSLGFKNFNRLQVLANKYLKTYEQGLSLVGQKVR